jgi:uncharacterized protein (DUF1015 family)
MTEPMRSQRKGRPLQLAPFRALRYSSDVVPDLAAVTCPPYDVIGDGGIATWEAADPYNVVRLILPRGSPHGDRYQHAASFLAQSRTVPSSWPPLAPNSSPSC